MPVPPSRQQGVAIGPGIDRNVWTTQTIAVVVGDRDERGKVTTRKKEVEARVSPNGTVAVHKNVGTEYPETYTVTAVRSGWAVFHFSQESDADRAARYILSRCTVMLSKKKPEDVVAAAPKFIGPWANEVNKARKWVDPEPFVRKHGWR